MFRTAIAKILANIVALYVAVAVIPGFGVTGGIITILFASVVLMLVNMFVRPLLKFVSLPFVFLSMGVFMFVINALMLWLTEKTIAYLVLQPQLESLNGIALSFTNWTDYLLASLIIGIVDYFTHWLLKIK